MADSSIWITCTLALALFDILPTKGSPTELSHAEGGSFTGDPISYVVSSYTLTFSR